MNTLRTQDEIVKRYMAMADEDWLGFRREALVEGLTHAAAVAAKLPVVADAWPDPTVESVEKIARDYLDFAYGKATDHRGISANRSVDKLREWVWLLGRDDVVSAMDEAPYENYGVPQLKAVAVGMGWPWQADDAELTRMAEGLPCHDGCESGCGS